MNKSKKNILINLLILAFVFFNSTQAIAAKPKAGNKKGKTENVDKKIEQVAKKRTREIKYTGFEAKNDPFEPPAKIAKLLERPDKLPGTVKELPIKTPSVILQGIIGSKEMPQAIISGSVMKVGDYIEDFQIKEISKNGVILFFKGEEYLIKMQSSQNKESKKTGRTKK